MTNSELEFLLDDAFTDRQDSPPMVQVVRGFMLLEAAAFAAAAMTHVGLLIDGFGHREASIAEGVIFAVLLFALALTWIRPAWTRSLGVAAQSFALVGTLAGIFFIAIGLGPRTAPDIAYHAGMVLVLVSGMIFLSPQVYERAA